MTEPVQTIELQRIDVGRRHRAFREDAIADLAESIHRVGLLNPISVVEVDGRYRLVAGLHRLEACRSLGWAEVPAIVLDADELDAELIELDENLQRRELSVLERGEHLVRRSEILEAKGVRATRGRPKKGAPDAPFSTTAELAQQAGVAERTAQQGMQIARSLPPEVRDLLRPTEHAASANTLLDLAKIKAPEKQLDVAKVLASGEVEGIYSAKHAVEQRYTACSTCGEVSDGFEFLFRPPVHCEQCGTHFAQNVVRPDLEVCGACGWKSKPWATPPGSHRVLRSPRLPQSSDIVGTLPEPFKRKGGHADTRVMLPVPEGANGAGAAPAASELACGFADAVDAMTAVDVSLLAAEASSPVVRFAGKKLGRWFDQLRPSLGLDGAAGQGQPAP